MAGPLAAGAGAPLGDVLDVFRGLPTHALVVHLTVVDVSVAAVAGVVYALLPVTRDWLRWPLAAVGLLTLALGWLTPQTGERLARHVPHGALLEKHEHLGHQLGTIMLLYGAVLAIAMTLARPRRPATTGGGSRWLAGLGPAPGTSAARALTTLLAAVVLAGGVVSGVWAFRTGEAGARSVWQGVATSHP